MSSPVTSTSPSICSSTVSDCSSTESDSLEIKLSIDEQNSVLVAANSSKGLKRAATLENYTVSAMIVEDNTSQIAFSIISKKTCQTIITANLSQFEFKLLTGRLKS